MVFSASLHSFLSLFLFLLLSHGHRAHSAVSSRLRIKRWNIYTFECTYGKQLECAIARESDSTIQNLISIANFNVFENVIWMMMPSHLNVWLSWVGKNNPPTNQPQRYITLFGIIVFVCYNNSNNLFHILAFALRHTSPPQYRQHHHCHYYCYCLCCCWCCCRL